MPAESSIAHRAAQYPALDVVRGIAAMLVVVEHTRSMAWVSFSALPAAQHTTITKLIFLSTRLGQEAVLAFFMLSGFLVGGQVIRQAREKRFDLHNYAIDRCCRILPPLLPAALFAAFVGWIGYGQEVDVWQVVCNMTGLNGVLATTLPFDAPLWSLAYETWFYVLAGALAAIGIGRGNMGLMFALLAAMLAFCRLDASLILIWIAGACVSALPRPRRTSLVSLAGACILIGGVYALQLARPSQSFTTSGFPISLARGIFAAGFALLLPLLVSSPLNAALSRRAWVRRPFGFLAAMSYTLYLFHYPTLGLLELRFSPSAVSGRSIGVFGSGVVAALLISAGMYFLVERNTPHFRRWLRRKTSRDARELAEMPT